MGRTRRLVHNSWASFTLGFYFYLLIPSLFWRSLLSINDSVYSSLFFFLTGLHFFHLFIGLFLINLLFWSCAFPLRYLSYLFIMTSDIHLFSNLLTFYWHFLEILWLFLFLLLYKNYNSLFSSFGDLFIHYQHQLWVFGLVKVSIFQILVN